MRKHYLTALILVSLLSWVLIYFCLDGSHTSPVQFLTLPNNNRLESLESQIKSEIAERGNVRDRIRKVIELKLQEKRQAAEDELNQKQLAETKKEENIAEKEKIEAISAHSENAIAILVFSCNRVTVTRCLDQLLEYRPSAQDFPIIVTQDCQHEATANAIRGYGDQVYHIQQPDQSEIQIPLKEKKFKGYFKIARHYGWALNQTFNVFNFNTVVIIEDDLDISTDIFEYFKGTLPLLEMDPTLWCVSAWNDNGKLGLIERDASSLLHRTDFFPGLGWMLTKPIWQELMVKWPLSYWDDWIRQPEQRKGRGCIRPEISRTRTFGKIGVSNGLFFEKHLKYIHLNEKYVPFTKLNLTYLLKDNYDVSFVKAVYECPVVSYQELKSNSIVTSGPVRIPYFTKDKYKRTAKMLGLMDDFRSGVPRTGYRGVVSFFYNNRRVYLAPNANWKGYDITWS